MPRKDSIEIGELTDSAFYILLSLIDEKHGYLIMKTIEALTNNEVVIGPASLYTTLKKLHKAGLISLGTPSDDNRIAYKVTQAGIEMLEKEVNRKIQMVAHADKFLAERGEQ